MIFQKQRFWIKNRRIFSKQKCLNFDKLDILILRLIWWKLRSCPRWVIFIFSRRFLIGFSSGSGLSFIGGCCLSSWFYIMRCIVGWRRRTCCWHTSWWKSEALTVSLFLILCGGWRLVTVVRSWSILVASIYIQWMGLLAVWFCFGRGWLPHSNKLCLLTLRPIDDLSTRWEHTVVDVVILSHLVSWTPITVYLICRLLDFSVWGVFLDTTHSLSSCTEETFHAIKVDNSLHTLRTLLWFFLYSIILAILVTYIVVAKPVLLLILPLWSLHLRLESIVNTLSLG